MSACRPAPPPESDPAMIRTRPGLSEGETSRSTRFFYPRPGGGESYLFAAGDEPDVKGALRAESPSRSPPSAGRRVVGFRRVGVGRGGARRGARRRVRGLAGGRRRG